VLFNEPKLLKSIPSAGTRLMLASFSALQRAEIAEMRILDQRTRIVEEVSVLFNEPKLLKSYQ